MLMISKKALRAQALSISFLTLFAAPSLKAKKPETSMKADLKGNPNKPEDDSDASADKKREKELMKVAAMLAERTQNCGSGVLNQIGSAFYTLAIRKEHSGEPNEVPCLLEKALSLFDKAASAGCPEAMYNAALAATKLKKYSEAAEHYRNCIAKGEVKDQELVLKAAVNLSILIFEKHVNPKDGEISRLIEIGERGNDSNSEALLRTVMLTLTEMNSVPSVEQTTERTKEPLHEQKDRKAL
jgi:tetratricopeptide (TPR) repeat protein